MSCLSRLAGTVLLTLTCLTAAPSPARADGVAASAVFNGSAIVDPGLWFPFVCFRVQNPPLYADLGCPLRAASWSFTSNVLDAVVGSPNTAPPVGNDAPLLGTNRVQASGTIMGYCGGFLGVGMATIGTHGSSDVTIVNVGDSGVIFGRVSDHVGTLVIVFQSRALPLEDPSIYQPCLDHPAGAWVLTGAAAIGAA